MFQVPEQEWLDCLCPDGLERLAARRVIAIRTVDDHLFRHAAPVLSLSCKMTATLKSGGATVKRSLLIVCMSSGNGWQESASAVITRPAQGLRGSSPSLEFQACRAGTVPPRIRDQPRDENARRTAW